MVSKTQVVKFEAFAAYTHGDDGEEVKCDVAKLLDGIKRLESQKRVVQYFGMPVRMDKMHDVILDDDTIQRNKDLRLMYFHMTKMRDEGAATAVLETEELTDLELDADEYMAEDISCLYDNKLKVLFIQRNYHSLSISGIAEYLKKVYEIIVKGSSSYDSENDSFDELDIFFKPVPDKEVLKNAQKVTNYRSLTLSFANDFEDSMSDKLKSMLGSLGGIFDSLGGTKVGIVLSAGDSKAKTLDISNTKDMISEVENGNSIFSSALIRGKRGDSPVEKFDLLNGKLQTEHKFSSVKDKDGKARKIHLDPNTVEDIMKLIYVNKDGNSTHSFRDKVIENLK
ncbi:hypothetical protein LTWDN19_20480 [Latilactobacillus curvatus]|uniref:Uncharacterized protein n=1 Tax=Latilactobacillus curvatus TaxID=28038 RepID=A0ABN6GL40_LATCU|nr:DUF6731 family protein [Latilactobacillus curvatus]BCX31481.1 hypothetical protein LTWDN19_20480 [Latilactobacillus curvatus]